MGLYQPQFFSQPVAFGKNECGFDYYPETYGDKVQRGLKLSGYLGGPIRNCTDDEAKLWRKTLIHSSPRINWKDPMVRDYRGIEDFTDPDAICLPDLDEVESCDFFMANMWKMTAGTMAELVYAATHFFKPTFVLTPSIEGESVWVRKHASLLFQDIADLSWFINNKLSLTKYGKCVII